MLLCLAKRNEICNLENEKSKLQKNRLNLQNYSTRSIIQNSTLAKQKKT